MYEITSGSATDTGKKRKINQDFFDCYIPRDPKEIKKGALLVLADGMGGYSGGEVASRMAVEKLMNNYYSDGIKNIIQSIKYWFQMANESIIDKAQQNSELKDMGTTLTAIVIKKNKLFGAHVGDSRAYLVSKNEMIQLTTDHSYVASLVRKGYITEEEAETHPERNLITRAVGVKKEMEIDTFKRKINTRTTPYLLICC
ncbi:protein serine/threonine phosphatase, partial [Candidatus Magnetomorum sp. HK-1]